MQPQFRELQNWPSTTRVRQAPTRTMHYHTRRDHRGVRSKVFFVNNSSAPAPVSCHSLKHPKSHNFCSLESECLGAIGLRRTAI
jgi:hypothetical protein